MLLSMKCWQCWIYKKKSSFWYILVITCLPGQSGHKESSQDNLYILSQRTMAKKFFLNTGCTFRTLRKKNGSEMLQYKAGRFLVHTFRLCHALKNMLGFIRRFCFQGFINHICVLMEGVELRQEWTEMPQLASTVIESLQVLSSSVHHFSSEAIDERETSLI